MTQGGGARQAAPGTQGGQGAQGGQGTQGGRGRGRAGAGRKAGGGGGARWGVALLAGVVLVAGAMVLAWQATQERGVALPAALRGAIEARLDAALAPGSVRLGAVRAGLGPEGRPFVRLVDTRLHDASGQGVARLPEMRMSLSWRAALARQIAPVAITLHGAEATVRRAPDGSLALALERGGPLPEGGQPPQAQALGAEAPDAALARLSELPARLNRLLDLPALSALASIRARDLTLRYDDAGAGREWRLDGGTAELVREGSGYTARVSAGLAADPAAPASVFSASLEVPASPGLSASGLSSGGLSSAGPALLALRVENVAAADIVAQVPALAALSVLDAPVSAALRTELAPDGTLGPLSATLELGAGALRPPGGAAPIGFRSAKSYLTYEPEGRRLRLDDFTLEADALALSGSGHAYLREITPNGLPGVLLVQLALGLVHLRDTALVAHPLTFKEGALDAKITLAPFSATIGQAVLIEGGQIEEGQIEGGQIEGGQIEEGMTLRAQGHVAAGPKGWVIALDAGAPALSAPRLLTLWPEALRPRLRALLAQRLPAGDIEALQAALRLAPGDAPRFSVSHRFHAARFEPGMGLPPIENGAGYAVFDEGGYTLSLEAGQAHAPDGGTVLLGGSSLNIPAGADGHVPEARLQLALDSGVESALSLLQLPLIGGQDPPPPVGRLESGRAQIVADLGIPLRAGLAPSELEVQVSGSLTGLRSTRLVPGRLLEAEALALSADRTEARLRGAARLDGVPLDLRWLLPRGPQSDGSARIEGQVPLSERTLAQLGLALPAMRLSGSAVADFTLDLAPGTAPRLRLLSDLNRLAVQVPWLGWDKPANARGRFELAGSLGAQPAFDTLRLSAPGLELEAGLELTEALRLATLRLDRLEVGSWLDLRGAVRGGMAPGALPVLSLAGGRLDLHRSPAQASAVAVPGLGAIELALDRVGLGDGLALAGVTGRLVPGAGGPAGEVRGALVGRGEARAPVRVTLAPGRAGRPEITLRAADAAALLRASGALPRAASGGALEMRLVPRADGGGGHDGWLYIDGLRVRDAPVLAELLSAISVIGLIEQLAGEGLLFSDVRARFTLDHAAIDIREARAVGPSLGLTLSGLYGRESGRIDMQGVISPVYLLNAVGGVLTRPGEGLFGFSFRLDGPAANPDVRLNPLSILAPGMLRELFRARRPEALP